MQFRESPASYLQIADYVCEKVLLKEWAPAARIPSVRELAVQFEVNPNTVMRTYVFLQQQEIIYNQRGIGFFIADGAMQQAIRLRKQTLVEKDLPQVYRNLYLLGMDTNDLESGFHRYKKQYFPNGK